MRELEAQLVERNQRLAWKYVHLLLRGRPLPSALDLDDLFQEGLLGLLEGIRRHDETRGSLANCVFQWVRSYVGKALASASPLREPPMLPMARGRAARLERELGRAPTPDELAAAFEGDYNATAESPWILAALEPPRALHLDAQVPGTTLTWADAIADVPSLREADPEPPPRLCPCGRPLWSTLKRCPVCQRGSRQPGKRPGRSIAGLMLRLLSGEAVPPVEELPPLVRKEFPKSRVSLAAAQWYASQYRNGLMTGQDPALAPYTIKWAK